MTTFRSKGAQPANLWNTIEEEMRTTISWCKEQIASNSRNEHEEDLANEKFYKLWKRIIDEAM